MTEEEQMRSYDAQSRHYATQVDLTLRGNKVMVMDLDPQPSEISSRAHAMLQDCLTAIEADHKDAPTD